MITETTVEGRLATVAYLTQDFEPADQEDAEMVKVTFHDTGEVRFGFAFAPTQITRYANVSDVALSQLSELQPGQIVELTRSLDLADDVGSITINLATNTDQLPVGTRLRAEGDLVFTVQEDSSGGPDYSRFVETGEGLVINPGEDSGVVFSAQSPGGVPGPGKRLRVTGYLEFDDASPEDSQGPVRTDAPETELSVTEADLEKARKISGEG